jgi:DHA2 family multidrug resistance protein-like MFS transporter
MAMDNPLSEGRRFWAIVALCCGNSVAAIDSSVLNVALPTIAREMHTPASATALVVSSYQLVLLITVLPFSALGEKLGLTRLYQVGQALFACAAIGSAFAPNIAVLIGTRALQAVGAACVLSISPALVRCVYPPEKLTAGLALNGFIVTTAAMAAPVLGGAVLVVAPWRAIFIVCLPLVLGSLAFGRALPATDTHDDPYDFRAAGLSAATFLLIFGAIQLAIHGTPWPVWSMMIVVGLGVGVVFVRREARSPRPVLPVDLLCQRVIAVSLISGFCVYSLSQQVMLGLQFRLQHVFGYSPAQSGAAVVAWPFALTLTVPLSGYFANRTPPGLLGALGMATSFTGLTALSFLPAHPSYFDLAWRLWLCGAGIGLFLAPNNRMIIGWAPAERIAAASGLIATMRMTGQVLGATLAALLLSLGAGLGRLPTLIAAGMTVVALVCCLSRLTIPEPAQQALI